MVFIEFRFGFSEN